MIEDRRDGTHLARTVGALDPELVDSARGVLTDDGLKYVIRILRLHRQHAVRQPLGRRQLHIRRKGGTGEGGTRQTSIARDRVWPHLPVDLEWAAQKGEGAVESLGEGTSSVPAR